LRSESEKVPLKSIKKMGEVMEKAINAEWEVQVSDRSLEEVWEIIQSLKVVDIEEVGEEDKINTKTFAHELDLGLRKAAGRFLKQRRSKGKNVSEVKKEVFLAIMGDTDYREEMEGVVRWGRELRMLAEEGDVDEVGERIEKEV
jgi:hypothetical protein